MDDVRRPLRHITGKASLGVIALLLAGCAIGPDYKRPDVPISEAYKEAPGWKVATPQDAAAKGPWWEVYGDPVLNDLVSQVAISNQNVKALEAAYRQAEGVVRESRSTLFPQITGNGGWTRSQRGVASESGTTARGTGRPANQYSLSASGRWDIDVWGRIRRSLESSSAAADASAADLANATLSYQAALATAYFELRSQDELLHLLESSITAYGEGLEITRNKYDAGLVSKTDISEALAQLKGTQAEAARVRTQRAQLEHAIAVLIGRPPAEVDIMPKAFDVRVPKTPVGVPSALLERRPDVAAAEYRVTAANARIGVAISAFFPDIVVSGSYGATSSTLDTLFDASSRVWSVGPRLAMTLFDAGAHSAQLDSARAAYDQEVARYRQTVLVALSDVEDALTALQSLEQRESLQAEAVVAAREAEDLMRSQYEAGTVAHTNVITAQTVALRSQQELLSVQREQLATSVALIQALGGGWNADSADDAQSATANSGSAG